MDKIRCLMLNILLEQADPLGDIGITQDAISSNEIHPNENETAIEANVSIYINK